MNRTSGALVFALGAALAMGQEGFTATPPNLNVPELTAPFNGTVDIEKPPVVVKRPPSSGNPLWAIPLSSLSFTRDRPIFSPSRRPPQPAVLPVAVTRPPPPPPPAAPERFQLQLVGTLASDTDQIALLVDPSTRNVVKLKVGEEYTGWILRSVQSRLITIQKGTQTEVLSLPKPEDQNVPSGRGGLPVNVGNPTVPAPPPMITSVPSVNEPL